MKYTKVIKIIIVTLIIFIGIGALTNYIAIRLYDKKIEARKEKGAAYRAAQIDYHNEKYDFWLTFPGTWENYHVTEKKVQLHDTDAAALFFGPDSQHELFTIYVFTLRQWDAFGDTPEIKKRNEVGISEKKRKEYFYIFHRSEEQQKEIIGMQIKADDPVNIIGTFRYMRVMMESINLPAD